MGKKPRSDLPRSRGTTNSELAGTPSSPRRDETGEKKKDRSVRLLGRTFSEARQHSLHDNFNVLSLPIICAMNFLCWDWSRAAFPSSFVSVDGVKGIWKGFTGDAIVDEARDSSYYVAFVVATLSYIILDLAFLKLMPHCVRSPRSIINHHIATILYIMVPIGHLPMRWFMGACMTVELNTWFMILRRVLNSKAKPKAKLAEEGDALGGGFWRLVAFLTTIFTPCGRIKLVSIFFWITWVLIRLIVYPALVPVACWMYCAEVQRSHGAGRPIYLACINFVIMAPVFQIYLTYLNITWSYNLYKTKMKGPNHVSKGL